jgi:hypothetical protein
MRLRRHGIAIALGLVLAGSSATACPECKTAGEVRRGIFNEDFAANLAMTLVPFGVFLGITAAIHRFPRREAACTGGRDGGC